MKTWLICILVFSSIAGAHEAGISRMDIYGAEDHLLVEWTVGEHDLPKIDRQQLARLLTLELNGLAYVPTEVSTRELADGDVLIRAKVPLTISSPQSFELLGIDLLPHGHRIRALVRDEAGKTQEQVLSWRSRMFDI